MTRKTTLLILAIVVLVIFLPAVVVSIGGRSGLPFQSANAPSAQGESESEKGGRWQVRLYRADQGEITVMDLDEYLVGVLLAEMPSSFEAEALKAQAVIARTYTLHQLRSLGGDGCDKAPGKADICSESTHCQAWLDPGSAAGQGGSGSEAFRDRIRKAVFDTRGEVVVYQGRLIEAVYHSTCGGKTEASHALWSGGVRPYLKSINCPYCQHSPHYRGEILIPFTRLAAALPQDVALPAASGDELVLEVASETPGGRVKTLSINGTLIEGKELRRLLELPSTAFTWEYREEGLFLITRGRGHGVGLCQYGADGAARAGKSYRQIIEFYYPGTEVTKIMP